MFAPFSKFFDGAPSDAAQSKPRAVSVHSDGSAASVDDDPAMTPASGDSTAGGRRWFSFGRDDAGAAQAAAIAQHRSESAPIGLLVDIEGSSHAPDPQPTSRSAPERDAAPMPVPVRALPPPSVALMDEDPGDEFERFPVHYLGWLEVGKAKGQLSPASAMLRLSQAEGSGTRAILMVSTWGVRVLDDATREVVLERPIQKIASCLSSDNKEVIAIVATNEAEGVKSACFVFRAGKHTHRITEATGRAFTTAYEKKVASSGGVTPESIRRTRAVSAPAPSGLVGDRARQASAPPSLGTPTSEYECCGGRPDCPAVELKALRAELQALGPEGARRALTELIETRMSIAERDGLFRAAKRSSAHFDAVPSAEEEFKSMLALVEGVFERRFVAHRQQMQAQQPLVAIGENEEEDKGSKIASSISSIKRSMATSIESLMGKVERARNQRLSFIRTEDDGPFFSQTPPREGDADSLAPDARDIGRASPAPAPTPRDSVTSIGSTSSSKGDGARRSWRRAIFKSVLLNQVEREVEEARSHADEGVLSTPQSPLPHDDATGASEGTAPLTGGTGSGLDEFDPLSRSLTSSSLDASSHLSVADGGKPRKSSEELMLLWRRAASLTAEEGGANAVDPEEARLEEVWKKRLGENDEAQLAAVIVSMGIGDHVKGASGASDTASVSSLPGAANGADGSTPDTAPHGHHGHHGHAAHHGGSKKHKQRRRLTGDDLARLMCEGVPRKYRARAWRLIVACRNPSGKLSLPDIDYASLLAETSPHEAQIRQDIGRTFPDHHLFSEREGTGQMALFHIMKAYSVLDPEVGYCQGLTFVGGILLMHVSEEDAFWVLVHLMQHLGLRDLYKPDMEALQVNLYQFSRLVYDHCPALHRHLERFDVKPFLYAAAWFLTLFASQFPLAFAFRVLDVLLAHGRIVIFKIGITLLRDSEQRLMRREGLEEIVSFLKTELPLRPVSELVGIVWTALQAQAVTADRLAAFENEYHIMRESMESGEEVSAAMRAAAQQWAAEKQELESRLAAADRRNQQLRARNANLESEVLQIRDTIIADYQRLLERMRVEKDAMEDAAAKATDAQRRAEARALELEAQLVAARARIAESENEKNALATKVRALSRTASLT